jgi:hypothetical protein
LRRSIVSIDRFGGTPEELMATAQGNEHREQEDDRVENMSKYEREKIETSLRDVENLARMIRSYLKAVDFATAKGVDLEHKADLSGIRTPNAMFDPVRKGGLIDMRRVFEDAMLDIQREIPAPYGAEFIALFKNEAE